MRLFIFCHSKFDVGRSMFDVQAFHYSEYVKFHKSGGVYARPRAVI